MFGIIFFFYTVIYSYTEGVYDNRDRDRNDECDEVFGKVECPKLMTQS